MSAWPSWMADRGCVVVRSGLLGRGWTVVHRVAIAPLERTAKRAYFCDADRLVLPSGGTAECAGMGDAGIFEVQTIPLQAAEP